MPGGRRPAHGRQLDWGRLCRAAWDRSRAPPPAAVQLSPLRCRNGPARARSATGQAAAMTGIPRLGRAQRQPHRVSRHRPAPRLRVHSLSPGRDATDRAGGSPGPGWPAPLRHRSARTPPPVRPAGRTRHSRPLRLTTVQSAPQQPTTNCVTFEVTAVRISEPAPHLAPIVGAAANQCASPIPPVWNGYNC